MAKSKVPGGYYIGVDGKPHDAWGRPIEPKAEEEAEIPMAEALETVKAVAAQYEERLPGGASVLVPQPEPPQLERRPDGAPVLTKKAKR